MIVRSRIAVILGAVGLAAAASYAPAASADRIGFNVTVGGPGYGFTVGNYGIPYGAPYGGYYAPAPVAVTPPVPYYYRPYRPYYAPVVVPAPYPVVRPYGYRAAWGYRHHYGHAAGVHGGHGHGHD
jgi:hypothetical protein